MNNVDEAAKTVSMSYPATQKHVVKQNSKQFANIIFVTLYETLIYSFIILDMCLIVMAKIYYIKTLKIKIDVLGIM